MATYVSGWTTLSEEPLVLVREYAFSKAGHANALVVGLPGRKLLLISPPLGVPTAELQALSQQGEVVALLAFNGAHHLGVPDATRAFPQATGYATAAARERIAKRSRRPIQLDDIAGLRPLLGDKIDLVAADGCRIGDVLVRVRTERGTLLFAGDFIANIASLPKNPLFKLVFKLTDSAPGLKVFRIFFRFFTNDQRAVRDFLVREIQAQPPAILVPGHGEVLAKPDLTPTLISLLQTAF